MTNPSKKIRGSRERGSLNATASCRQLCFQGSRGRGFLNATASRGAGAGTAIEISEGRFGGLFEDCYICGGAYRLCSGSSASGFASGRL
ncbi:MAG: hypothetical protein HDS18_03390 [Bacteroides sp.]|nr:hypothetical protein [Bacteroides sp.]